MGKTMGAMLCVFAAGAGTTALLGSFLGTYAEAASVTFMGFGLFGFGQLLGTRFPHAAGHAQPVQQA